ncbi:MAG: NADH-quinone oxidoreductase subunit L [Acidobacteria bacterium]|nr:NADH-quinone oxidoreductase subunit L [Acidobacteriota bacterium]
MVGLLWLIPALPLAGFLMLLLFGKRIGEPVAGWLGTAAVAGSFVTALVVFAGLWNEPEHTYSLKLFEWMPAGRFSVDIGFLLDPLSMAMILFITGIAALIHLYSIGYMHGDSRFPRFFTYLNLFVFSMLMLVMGDNLVLTFLGWEGVGACSYFLISFWFEKDANASAGKKAFITNRVGDWGFMVGTFATFFAFGTVKYVEFLPQASGLAQTTATFIVLMLFIGAIGKSAQIPLFIWLPDAMAGPTPVSALIHAATMVTAGVYLLVRVNPLIAASASWLPWVIAGIGVATAFLAATIAIAQTDIKKVLAYSTVSQLGFMFLAVGAGGYSAAIFHMITHAFFKACMFLGSGSVIHGMHEEQDMRRMGALRKVMPITAITFIIGWLAIAGVPPFSGFWSKDDILAYALHKSIVLYVIGLITALLTAFYMSRQVFMVFFGRANWGPSQEAELANKLAHETAHADGDDPADAEVHADAHGDAHDGHGVVPHESPRTMTIPLIVLAFFAATAGVLNLPFTEHLEFLNRWLEPVVGAAQTQLHLSGAQLTIELLISTVVALSGIAIAYAVYLKHKVDARRIELPLFANGWYIDSAISNFMGGLGRRAFEMIAHFDRVVIDGAVNGVARATRGGAMRLRSVQSGYVRWYALMIGVGTVAIVAFVLTQVSFS